MNSKTLNFYIKAISDFSDVQDNVKNFQKAVNQLKLPDDLKRSFSNIFEDFEKESKKYQKFLDSGFKKRGDVTGLESSGERVSKILTKLHSQLRLISEEDLYNSFKIDTSSLEKAENKLANIKKQIAQITITPEFKKGIDDINKSVNNLGTKSKFAEKLKEALSDGDIKKAEEALEGLVENHRQFNDQAKENKWKQGIEELRTSLNELKNSTGLTKLIAECDEAEEELNELGQTEFNKLIAAFTKVVNGAEDVSNQYKKLKDTAAQTAFSQHQIALEMENFHKKLLQFFSIDNAVLLFRRALSAAFESVKELDEVMTQTAVVTDFTVGDMWSQLPEYTQRANELGVAVKGAYEAATLYYQQGLSTNEVVGVSAETLKMARIAGMDYALATDYMTAALRGFNMEINENTAGRVNDVYSELAAITASDTQEIATAMTKTASIANSANMEFETTAAFLSQIIETTRESAETAGTAMKTVIARFQELKKDPSLIGEVDGEIVDANKIETALRTIGVPLRDVSGQFRDLDDVFLEIASKWKSLDTNTQRYIATMAAGSRQQSRFIAMMSDYERTMQLVDAANNSAGASQKQFEKTLESLDSKLAKLDNAWKEFTLGVANSEFVKTGVDLLTLLLESVNNLTGAFGDAGSAFTKLLLGLGALKGGKALLGSPAEILKAFGTGDFSTVGKNLGKAFGRSFKDEATEEVLKLKKNYGAIIAGIGLGAAFAGNQLKNAGFEDAGEIIMKLGNIATVTGTILSVVLPLAAKTGATGITAALMGSPLAAFAAVAGAAAAVITVIEQLHKTSEEKLQELEDNLASSQEAARQTREEYDNLMTSLARLDESESSLKNLVEGTNEWKDGLYATNQQVLELLRNFEGLEIEVVNGQLALTEESRAKVVQQQKERTLNTDIAAAGASFNISASRQRESLARIGLADGQETIGPKDEAFYAAKQRYVTFYEENTALVEKYLDNIRSLTNEEIRFIQENLPQVAIEQIVEGIKEYKSELNKSNAEIQSQLTGILGVAVSDNLKESQNFGAIVSTFSANRSNDYLAKVQDQKSGLIGDKDDLRSIYEQEIGIAADENWTEERLRQEIAAFRTIKQYANDLEKVLNTLKKETNPNKQASLYGYLTDGQTLRKNDSTLVGATDAIVISIAEALGKTPEIVAKEVNTIIESNKARFSDLETRTAGSTGQYATFRASALLNDATFAQYSGYMTQLGAVAMQSMAKGGEEAAAVAADTINSTLESILDSNIDKRDQILNIFAASDLTTTSGLESFYESLKAIGVNIPLEKQNVFISRLKELGAVVNDISLNSLINQVKSLRDLADKIRDKDLSEGFTQEERDEIIKARGADESDFYWTGQEYIYLGDSMNALADILDNNSVELAENRVAEIKSQIASGENFEERFKATGDSEEQLNTIYDNLLNKGHLLTQEGLEAYGYSGLSRAEASARFITDYQNYQNIPALQAELVNTETQVEQENTFAKTPHAITENINEANLEEISTALQAQARDLNVAKAEIDNYSKALEANKDDAAAAAEASRKFANLVGDKQTERKLKKTSENIGDITEKYDDLKDATDEDIQNIGTTLGLKELEVGGENFEFIRKNLDLINQAMEGDIASMEALQAKLAEGAGFSVTGDGDFTALNEDFDIANQQAQDFIKKLIEAGMFEVEWIRAEQNVEYLVPNEDGTGFDVKTFDSGAWVQVVKPVDAPAIKGATNNYSGSSRGSGGGGGSSEPPENPYDKQHNIIEQIDENLRERNKLESDFEILRAKGNASLRDHVDLQKAVISSLKDEIRLQKTLLSGRYAELEELVNQNPQALNYGSYSEETRLFTIDYEAIEKLRLSDAEKFEEIIDILNKIEEASKSAEETSEKILDAEKALAQRYEQSLNGYIDFEERVASALQTLVEKEIEVLEKEFSALTDAENALAEAVNTSISEARQARDNDRTEEDIAEKERRLAYLRQDTSGANALVIKRLEEELQQQKEDYQDSLVDQALNNIQEQNKIAQEQRERQIELMQSQLDWDIENGTFHKKAETLIQAATQDGIDTKDEALYKILSTAEGWPSKTKAQLEKLTMDFNSGLSQVIEFLKAFAQKEAGVVDDFENSPDLMRQIIDIYLANGRKITTEMRDLLNARTERIEKYNIQGVDTFNNSIERLVEVLEQYTTSELADPNFTLPVNEETYNHPNQTSNSSSNETTYDPNEDYMQLMIDEYKAVGYINDKIIKLNNLRNQKIAATNSSYPQLTLEELEKELKKRRYASGGLADFTGPAWLDGTKSRPELVLNQQDTQNFLMLKDVLSGTLRNLPDRREEGGDNYFDIDIQVDEISDDYDVDQMVERIKQNIYTDSMYRNVNTVNLLR